MKELELSSFLKEAGIIAISIVDDKNGNPTILIFTKDRQFKVRVKDDSYDTGKAIDKECKALDQIVIDKLKSLIEENWEEIAPSEEPETEENAQPFEPKYHYDTFEAWQIVVGEKYHTLHKTVETNFRGAWPAFEFVLAVMAILRIKEITLPFIGIILGPASGVKTLILELLRRDSNGKRRRNTFFTHKFNPRSIVSHTLTVPKGAKENSQHMLLQMKNNIVLVPELAPIFTKEENELRETLGDFTAVADGNGFESNSGLGHAGFAGNYFFVFAGATVDIPWYVYKVLGELGPKLFFFRLPAIEDSENELLGLLQDDTFAQRKQRISEAFDEYIDVFESCPKAEIVIDVEAEHDKVKNDIWRVDLEEYRKSNDKGSNLVLAKLAILLRHLRARTTIYRAKDEHGLEDFVYQKPNLERPTRAVTQLRNISLGLAFSMGRPFIISDDLHLATRITLSTAPTDRCDMFEELLKKGKMGLTTSDIEKLRNVHPNTARRTMTDLSAIGLVTQNKRGGNEKDQWEITLKEKFEWFLSIDFQTLMRYYEYNLETQSYKDYLQKIENDRKPADSVASGSGSGLDSDKEDQFGV